MLEHRLVRWLLRLLGALALVVVFALSLALGVVAHLDLPRVKQAVLVRVNAALESAFQGRLEIQSARRIDSGRLLDARARVLDPRGVEVIAAEGIDVDFDTTGLVRSLVGGPAVDIHIDEVVIDDARVRIEEGPSGELTLVEAFAPPPGPSTPAARPTEVRIDRIRIAHAWVHGSLPALPTIDADLSRLVASLSFTERKFSLDVGRAEIAARNLPRRLDAQVDLSGTLALDPEEPEALAAHTELTGRVAGVRLDFAGDIDRSKLSARLRVPKTPPEALRRILPELPLYEPVALEAELSGALPDLRAKIDLGIGRGRVFAASSGRVGARPSLSFELEGRSLSPRMFSPAAPDLRLTFDARGSLLMRAEGSPYGELQLRTQPTRLGSVPIPALSIDGYGTDQRIEGRAIAHERGAPIELDLAFLPRKGGGRLELAGRMMAPELAQVSRLDKAARGRLLLRTQGAITLPRGDLDFVVSAHSLGLGAGPLRTRAATLTGTLGGTLKAPSAELLVRASYVEFLGRHASRLELSTSGPLLEPAARVSLEGPDLPTLSGRAKLALSPPAAQHVRLELERAGVQAQVSARRIVSRQSRLRVDDLTFSGPGALAGSFEVGPGVVRARARAEELDLGKLATLLSIPRVQRGSASFDVNVRSSARGYHGRLEAKLRDVSAYGVKQGNARAELELDGRHVTGTVDAAIDKAISVNFATSHLHLPRGKLTLAKLRELRGGISLDANADLARLRRLLPQDTAPLSSVRGQLALHARVIKNHDDREIEAKVELRTRGFYLQGPGVSGKIETRREALRLVPWTISGLDAELDLHFHNDRHPSHLSARIYDKRGTLLRAQAETSLRLSELVHSPEHALERMMQERVSADVWLPRRPLGSLPTVIRPQRIVGNVAVGLHLRGKPIEPELALSLRADELRPKNNSKAPALAVSTDLEYADGSGKLAAALSDGQRGSLTLDSQFRARLGQLLSGKDPELVGSAALSARNFRLESIPVLADRQFRGRVVGGVRLRGLGYAPKLDGALAIHELQIARNKLESVRLTVDAEDGHLASHLALRQSDGYLDAHVDAGIRWRRLLPELSEKGPLKARVGARNFRAGVLLPLVDTNVSKLDGRVDGNVALDVAPGKTALSGQARVRDGSVQIPAVGQEFRKIRGRVELEPNGVVKLHDVSARGLVGRLRASAAARLAGLRFVAARAKVRIDNDEKIPLTVEGVSLGNAWGKIDLEARAAGPRKTRLDVDVRSFHLEMPRLGQREIQSLDDAQRIRIGVRRDAGFISLPLQPLEEEASGEPSELVVRVKLGDDVWIRQGAMLRVRLDGAVAVRVTDEPRITGKIQLSGGRIDVQGKMFDLVYGTLTFNGESPPNPIVVARARWESPDGIVVYADFSGPVDNGKLTLHSDPALTDDQILALLLFGTPDGTLGAGRSGEGGRAATAVGVGGGVATQGLNAALGRLTDLDVTARIDTSGQQARPELAFQVSRRLTAAVGYNVGEPAPGKAPDRTLLILDFRLGRRWSLASTFGDRGSSLLDLVWRYRY